MLAQQTLVTSQPITEVLWWCLISSTEKYGLQALTELRQWQRWVMNGQWQRVPRGRTRNSKVSLSVFRRSGSRYCKGLQRLPRYYCNQSLHCVYASAVKKRCRRLTVFGSVRPSVSEWVRESVRPENLVNSTFHKPMNGISSSFGDSFFDSIHVLISLWCQKIKR